jgi:RNA polymerase sigma-70 factor (ECF subfamily)
MISGEEFESVVALYYEPLYRFAFSLARTEPDACDLTQQTFYIWATKGHQLRDESKVKTWLFTTLHRLFLEMRRKQTRFPHQELSEASVLCLASLPPNASELDSAHVLRKLGELDELYQAPVALFYLQDCSYKEIAEILELPIGTVKSRLARGIAFLQQKFSGETRTFNRNQEGRK